ncbi:hypothetical protein [Thomasclavelia cocleata]|uniref:hypothetical protein n=2 Tax=Thomasclavelia cocleata TaxID=69824 RepID=UPI0025A95095|nr:hypothetical protein [Thomasclavelia cocleata]
MIKMTEERKVKSAKLSRDEREKKLIQIADLYAKSSDYEKSYLDGVIAAMSALNANSNSKSS